MSEAINRTVAVVLALPLVASAAAEDPMVKVYFGAGCFWHVQHEFVMEEVATLSRSGGAITAVSGYAGGTKVGADNRVCYHNFQGIGDYGELGHAEVVQVQVPASALPAFAKRYFSLFGERGYRHDPQDRGGEYRSLLGLPGGIDSPHFPVIQSAAAQSPMKLFKGEGDEPDTLSSKAVLVMDSDKFPFYPAEVYHQFHNDFMGPPYGVAYNKLQQKALEASRIGLTGCPDRAI
ncbi:hypothetical protein AB1Y20_010506 [Prymnesium parvum]|uniref:peptide-methionine (S)-S-oxide reductase n=1 Tax=Prymnesium parvum TaxID=97485 RepID=A0AB34INV7_PRYPA